MSQKEMLQGEVILQVLNGKMTQEKAEIADDLLKLQKIREAKINKVISIFSKFNRFQKVN